MPQQFPVLNDNYPLAIITITLPAPDPKKTPEPKKWTFSFQYWRQIEYFAFDRTDASWFASLLEKLTELSKDPIEKFLCDSRKIDIWRYHTINWNQTNIPIQIEDLDWLPQHCKENQTEFPLVQFQVSMALGRVVGFWDRDHVFNIVLLDPWHNIQPHRDHNYRVDPCSPLTCDYTKLLHKLEEILVDHCDAIGCEVTAEIRGIRSSRDDLRDSNVLIIKLNDDDIDLAQLVIEEKRADSLTAIFRDGLQIHYKVE